MATRDLMQRAVKPISLQDELIRFSMLSSVRGVPRILRSRSFCWQAVWLVSVSGFLSISLVLIVRLISTYLSYQTVLEVTTKHYTETVPFPSVTICNLQPFSTDMVKRFIRSPQVNVTDMRFLNELMKIKNHPNYTSSFKALNEKSFLYQNWGIETVRQIGLTFHEFVLEGTCNFSFVQAARFQQRPCNLSTDVLLIPNPQFFTCFMISPTADIANTTYSLEMDLYLDTEQMFDCQQTEECHDALFDLDDSIGAHVLVHPAMTYPHISQLGIHVLPGTKSVIEVVETRSLKKYSHSPKETCTSKRSVELFIGSKERQAAYPFAYESFTCRQLMVQETIERHCSCVDPDYPLTAGLSRSPFCGLLKSPGDQNTESFIKNYECASRQELDPRNLVAESTDDRCGAPCQSTSFKTTAYQSLWPPKTNELDFYRLRVQGKSLFGNKFDAYGKAENFTRRGLHKEAADVLKRDDANTIRENFLRLRVFRPDLSLTVTQEKLQITLETLISQIGGSFSLWGGLTVITSVELLEFLYYLAKRLLGQTVCSTCCCQRRTADEPEGELAEPMAVHMTTTTAATATAT